MPAAAPGAALLAVAGIGERMLIGALGDGDALQADASRALFIITNIAARPRFSWPTR